MQKREPVIIAPDYTDDELYEWMRQKINAAALSIARMITYPR